ncbi:hypothetical protein [Streptomyces longispororuber]|uniref:hypothetical protein n=1 Tax=Streptomyces longispororuber TaxID=68230 RepID=UPI00210D586D|nr:hypothetical protein [Streptomyces longispororuber]MCQ4212519.1 hypothetical protein [Streptomyces longispororuber]
MALAWVVPGLLLALALRWERMAHENMRHVDPDLPVKATSGRRIATRLGVMWALLTVMFWAGDASKGRPVDWPAHIVLAGALTVFALAVGYGASRAAMRRRGRWTRYSRTSPFASRASAVSREIARKYFLR